MIKLFLDVLDKPRQELWSKLGVLSRNGGVLAGGTAIALQIKHRISEDFDIFVPDEIPRAARQKAYQIMGSLERVPIDDSHQLTLLSRTGLKLTLVSHPYPPLHKLVKTENLPLFDLRDLASNKAYTIGRRGTWRDYIDLYFLLRDKVVTLSQLIKDAKQRFGPEFDPRRFLNQLTFTRDLGDFNIEFVRDPATPIKISQFLIRQVKEFPLVG